MRKISINGIIYTCETKEQFLDAQFKALIDVKNLANSVRLSLLEQVYKEANELFGETKHNTSNSLEMF